MTQVHALLCIHILDTILHFVSLSSKDLRIMLHVAQVLLYSVPVLLELFLTLEA